MHSRSAAVQQKSKERIDREKFWIQYRIYWIQFCTIRANTARRWLSATTQAPICAQASFDHPALLAKTDIEEMKRLFGFRDARSARGPVRSRPARLVADHADISGGDEHARIGRVDQANPDLPQPGHVQHVSGVAGSAEGSRSWRRQGR